MLSFRKIKDSRDILFEKLLNLYSEAFPINERRSHNCFRMILDSKEQFNLYVILFENEFVGFITYWEFNDFTYIEHFAIISELRGNSIGSNFIKLFFSKLSLPVVFEVEKPDNHIAARRIILYQRLGCYVLPQYYEQPFYDKSGNMVPMLIMSNNYEFTYNNFDRIKNILYEFVYEIKV